MSSKSNTKKRRVGDDTPAAETENNNNELIAIKSTMNELVHQNRTQNENIANMLQLMKTMQSEMKDMQGEITQLRKKCDDVHTEVSSVVTNRFDMLDNKQKYHEVILKNQKWTFPTIAHSLEYRSSLGQHEIAEVTKFLKQVEFYTRKMRYGTASGQIALQVYNESPDFLRYNKELLPYWKEFASAVEQHQHYLNCMPNNEPKTLHLYNIELSEDVLDLLAKAFKPIQFGKFVLRRNNFGQRGIEFALDYLESNNKCNTFGLMQNAVSNMHNHINRLCEIIKQHQSIKTLALRDMTRVGGMINGYEMLRMLMTAGKEQLSAIDLSGNEISTGGDTFISDFLAGKNYALKNLVLKSNQLDDNDAMAVASALKHNTNLRELNISSNNLTNLGWEALGKAVFDKTSLNTAADSNHKCHIDFPDGDEIIDIIRNSNGKTLWCPSKLRRKKVYSILSARNRNCLNVDHFDEGMPVELLPDMLRSIQKYAGYHNADSNSLPDNTFRPPPPPRDSQDVKPLSVMFEILQRWDKSLAVFEALSS